MLDRCSSQNHHYQRESMSMEAEDASSTCFSLFFPPLPLPSNKVQQWPDCDDHSSITSSQPSSPSSPSTGSVDCTLSLWTPSSRRAAAAEHQQSSLPPELTNSNKQHIAAAADYHHHQASYSLCRQQGLQQVGKHAANKGGGTVAHDAFVDRRCANCGTSSTPLWRNGPRGPKSLCNACGIRFKKEERRAAAMESAAGCGYIAQQRAQYDYARPGAEAAFPCGDADPFLAWRLNVVAPAPAPPFAAVWPERTSLFQYN